MKITEKEIRDIVRSELELNEGLFDFRDSPILQGLGVVKPRSEEEKKQAEIERLKKLLPPEEKKQLANTVSSPEEYFGQHQMDVEGFIRDLLLNDIDDKTKIFDQGGTFIYYDGSGEHDFEPEEVNKLRNDFIDKRLKVFFSAYDLDLDGQYGDSGDVGVALKDKIANSTISPSDGYFTNEIDNIITIDYNHQDDLYLGMQRNVGTLPKVRRQLSKIFSKYISSKFADISPESGEYFMTSDNNLGWRKQVAVFIPKHISTVIDKNYEFFDWATTDPAQWEKEFEETVRFGVFGYKIQVIYNLDLPIDQAEDPNFSPEAIRQRNEKKIMQDLERQEKMMDYDAQSGYETPDVDLESFSTRSMFEFTKAHPYAWEDFKTTTITKWEDISSDKEEARKILISNSLKMYKELDINSIYAQLASDEEKRKKAQEERRRKKAERTEMLRQRTEANKLKRAAAREKYKAAQAAEAARLAAIEAEERKKKDKELAAASKARNIRIQEQGIGEVFVNDILSYKLTAPQDLQSYFVAIEAFKPVIKAIVDDTSNPKSKLYKQALKGMKTRLKNLAKSGEIYDLRAGGQWGTSPGYRQLRGLIEPIFEDLLEELREIEHLIGYQRSIAGDPNLYVAIPSPFDKVTKYNLNDENELFDMRDLILDLK